MKLIKINHTILKDSFYGICHPTIELYFREDIRKTLEWDLQFNFKYKIMVKLNETI